MKIRHTILFLAAGLMTAVLSLNSCDNRMGSDLSDGFSFSATAVSYNRTAGTKAAPINSVSDFESTYTSFMVSAYKSSAEGATERFKNGTASYANEEWSLSASNAKWYPNETLDFFAIAPANLGGMETPNFLSHTVYFGHHAVPGDDGLISGSEVPDVMFGYYSGEGVLNTASSKRVAPLTFYHLFSAIRFVAGDIAGAKVNSIKIRNAGNSGHCVINFANLATVGSEAVSWTLNNGVLADYGDIYSVTAVEDEQIGTDAQTLMIFPQTLGPQAKLEVSLTVTDEGVESDVTLEASLKDVVLEAGKILTFKINYADIPISIMEPEGMIIPYIPTAAVHIDDPQLIPKIAYLPTGTDFKNKLNNLAVSKDGSITKIVFDRFGSVSEDAVEIQAASPLGEPIYASYVNGVVTITTHANTIYLNEDCSHMFQDMTNLTEIQWGNFFESEGLKNISYMFAGCESLLEVNFTDVIETYQVTDMSHLFDECSALTEVSLGIHFSTRNVRNQEYMFNGCSALINIDTGGQVFIGGPLVTNMDHMFYNCSHLYQVSIGNCSSVINMNSMFENCNLYLFYVTSWTEVNPELSAVNMLKDAFRSTGHIDHITHNLYNWLIDPANQTGLTEDIPVGQFIDFE